MTNRNIASKNKKDQFTKLRETLIQQQELTPATTKKNYMERQLYLLSGMI